MKKPTPPPFNPERDVRMVRCVLDNYSECPANTPAACICNQMPRAMYEERYKLKYGDKEKRK
jgi:hypothetical protein